MTMEREQESLVSRRSILTTASAALVGATGAFSLASASVTSAAADVHGDAVLIEAWAKYQAAMAHNAALNEKIEPLHQAALASLPPHLEREEFLRLSEEEQQAYREERMNVWEETFDKHGVIPSP